MKLNSSLNENITSQPIKVERHSNFELLRIIAMIMIIGHHLVVHGIQKFSGEAISYGNIINKIFINILNCGGEVGVALFFMITGFFLCKKEKTSIKKVACETAFYSVVIGIIFLITLIVEKSQSYGGGYFLTGICVLN